MFTVFSTSLNTSSRSRILARTAHDSLVTLGEQATLVDLNERRLPICNAGDCYTDENVIWCAEQIRRSRAVLIATPIYNYDVSASAKNLIELTGRAWREKIVGFLAAAGGTGSYMSVMGLANSLMLDFRVLVVPRFVFATEDSFLEGSLADPEVHRRTVELTMQTVWLAKALGSKE